MRARVLRWLALLALTGLAAGCQLVDEPIPPPRTPTPSGLPPLGSPGEEFPTTIAELQAFTRPEAQVWQEEPVLTDVTVWLGPDGRWQQFRAGYVAAHADRLLTVRATPARLRVQRPLLAGLELLELGDEAVRDIAPFPGEALEPAALGRASRTALAACEVDGAPVEAVIYATGAPGSWDGEAWTVVPTWRATVVTADGGAVVDPTSGSPFAPLTCVEPLAIPSEA